MLMKKAVGIRDTRTPGLSVSQKCLAVGKVWRPPASGNSVSGNDEHRLRADQALARCSLDAFCGGTVQKFWAKRIQKLRPGDRNRPPRSRVDRQRHGPSLAKRCVRDPAAPPS